MKDTIGKKQKEEGVVLILYFINFLAISGGVAESKDKETCSPVIPLGWERVIQQAERNAGEDESTENSQGGKKWIGRGKKRMKMGGGVHKNTGGQMSRTKHLKNNEVCKQTS